MLERRFEMSQPILTLGSPSYLIIEGGASRSVEGERAHLAVGHL